MFIVPSIVEMFEVSIKVLIVIAHTLDETVGVLQVILSTWLIVELFVAIQLFHVCFIVMILHLFCAQHFPDRPIVRCVLHSCRRVQRMLLLDPRRFQSHILRVEVRRRTDIAVELRRLAQHVFVFLSCRTRLLESSITVRIDRHQRVDELLVVQLIITVFSRATNQRTELISVEAHSNTSEEVLQSDKGKGRMNHFRVVVCKLVLHFEIYNTHILCVDDFEDLLDVDAVCARETLLKLLDLPESVDL